jgi:hypothetical protein
MSTIHATSTVWTAGAPGTRGARASLPHQTRVCPGRGRCTVEGVL